jgi:hypothetical protein
MRGTTIHSCTKHQCTKFLQHQRKQKTLSTNRKLRRDRRIDECSFFTSQKHKLNTTLSIQRVAHRLKSLSPTTSSRSHTTLSEMLAVLKPNRIIHKRTDANCNNFHLRVFLGLSNPQGQRLTSTLCIPCDNFGERKTKFNLGMSRTTQM